MSNLGRLLWDGGYVHPHTQVHTRTRNSCGGVDMLTDAWRMLAAETMLGTRVLPFSICSQ
jgi:hypothetical protein